MNKFEQTRRQKFAKKIAWGCKYSEDECRNVLDALNGDVQLSISLLDMAEALNTSVNDMIEAVLSVKEDDETETGT